MPELREDADASRGELLDAIRQRLASEAPALEVVAQDLLGAESRIDLLALERGRLVVVLVAAGGDELALVARGMAQRAWVAARARDWIQLAPQLGIRPDAEVRVLLLATEFGPESRAAAAALGDAAPELRSYRGVRNGAVFDVLLAPASARPSAPPVALAAVAAPPPGFRCGLEEADLGLTEAERRELEG